MTDERREARDRLGPFQLGPSHDDLGPGLGCLYEAWETGTGAPVLLLKPDTLVDWQPEGPWRIQLAFDPAWAAIAVKVEESPAPPDVSDLNNLLVLTTAGVTRVEERPRVRTHLATPLGGRAQPLARRPEEGFVVPRRLALAGAVALTLGLGVWLRFITSTTVFSTESEVVDEIRSQDKAPSLIDIREPAALGWVPLAQRPPCLEEQAEYKGKCYLPVEPKERVPQSAQP